MNNKNFTLNAEKAKSNEADGREQSDPRPYCDAGKLLSAGVTEGKPPLGLKDRIKQHYETHVSRYTKTTWEKWKKHQKYLKS